MKKPLILILSLVLLTITIIILIFISQIYSRPKFDGQKNFIITQGESAKKIISRLKKQNIISSETAFEIYLYLTKKQTELQAGSYILTPVNLVELTDILVAGKVDNEKKITLIEGWSIDNVATLLVNQKIISNTAVFKQAALIKNFANEFDFLQNLPQESLEGFIFPDTYQIYKDSTPSDLIKKALANFNKKITPAIRTEIIAQGKNLYDILIMASIIEQEIPHEEDRQIVSGILWKRLKNNMKLQVDSSLKYIIGKKDRNILTFEELKIDSPYNTYKYTGLPPTPICNPGESAIRATIYPKDSDFWFYLSTPEGETIFSQTGAEHEANVEKYLK